MSLLTGKGEEELFSELQGAVFLNPLYVSGSNKHEQYLLADEYLSGNVREKLAVAKNSATYNAAFSVNVEALEQVQPQDLAASEIDVRLGATWLPVETVQQFIFDLLSPSYYARNKIKVHYSRPTAIWNIENKNADYENVAVNITYGTKRVNAYKIIEETLNLKDVRVFDTVQDINGNEQRVLNKKETILAQQKQQAIKDQFAEWIWKDAARRGSLTKLYNEEFNSMRPREYDGSHIAVRPPGKERFVRLRSLGENYTEEAIRERILRQRSPRKTHEPKPKRVIHVKVYGDFRLSKITWKGLRALYFFYLRKLRAAQHQPSERVPYLIREDLRLLDKISEQNKFLIRHKVDTPEQLAALKESAEYSIKKLSSKRKELMNEKRRTDTSPMRKAEIMVQMSSISAELKTMRQDVRMCADITKRAETITRKHKQLKEQSLYHKKSANRQTEEKEYSILK